jgi:hypothetical protein
MATSIFPSLRAACRWRCADNYCGETLCCGDSSTPWIGSKITSKWLTAILRKSDAISDAVTVKTFRKADLSGIGLLSCMWRVKLGYEGNMEEIERAPQTVIVKFTSPEFKQRLVSAWFGFYRAEVAFYEHLNDVEGFISPKVFFAKSSGAGSRFTLVMQDMDPHKSCDQLVGCTVPQAEQVLASVCKLHAQYYNDPKLKSDPELFRLLPSFGHPCFKEGMATYADALKKWKQMYSPPADVVTFAEAYATHRDAFIADTEADVFTVTHGDCRLDNVFFLEGQEGAGGVTMCDFQCVKRHAGEWDLAYLLCVGTPAGFRKANEVALVEFYHKTLCAELKAAKFPGSLPTLDSVWSRYRKAIIQITPTLVISAVSIKIEDDSRGAQIMREMNDGFVAAVQDHDLSQVLAQIVDDGGAVSTVTTPLAEKLIGGA